MLVYIFFVNPQNPMLQTIIYIKLNHDEFQWDWATEV